MKKIYEIIFVATTALSVVCCSDNTSVFEREDDVVTCDCSEQTISQVIKCDGKWTSDCSGVDWIKVNPESGHGDGKYYSTYEIHVEYNEGDAREGTFYLVHDGKKYPVTVYQGKCDFAFEAPSMTGAFLDGKESDVVLHLPYVKANGTEVYEISCNVTSETVHGLYVTPTTFDSFSKGSGVLDIPVSGIPDSEGVVAFEVLANGKTIGICEATVYDSAGGKPSGLEVGWNFYDAGIPAADLKGSEYDYSWTSSAAHWPGSALPSTDHKVYPNIGNEKAYLTASCKAATDYTFNPSVQIKGMMLNDYFMAVVPVMNITSDVEVSVEASFGAAGSAAGVFSLEYSADGTSWKLASGSRDTTIFNATGKYHYYVSPENTSSTRKTYDKANDKSYRKYTFPLEGIEPVKAGNLYVRLRVSMDVRAGATEKTNTIGKNTWCDLKGLEIYMKK
mgnify:FL=1